MLFTKSELQRARSTAEKLIALVDAEERRQSDVEQALSTVRQSFTALEGAVAVLNRK